MRAKLLFLLCAFAGVISIHTPASAQDEARRIQENVTYVWTQDRMTVIEPDRGRDKVGPIKPNWCDLVEPEPKPWKSRLAARISRTVSSGSRQPQHDGYNEGQKELLFRGFCTFPDDPGYQEQAGYWVQFYLNLHGHSRDQAIAWMRKRADMEAWKAAQLPPPGSYPGTLVVVEPAPGREKVGPVKPTWCDQVEIDRRSPEHTIAGRVGRVMESTTKWWFNPGNTRMLFEAFCAFPDHPGFQEQAGYMVQLWVNQTGQSKAEAIESLTLRANPEQWEAQQEEGCNQIRVPEEASAEEEQMIRARRQLLCNDKSDYFVFRGDIWGDYEWYIDRTDEPPSELDRLTYALECLPSGGREWNRNDWMRVGLCSHDVQALDRAKIEKETAGMTAPLKSIALESYSTAKTVLADLERSAQEKVGSDPDYKKLLYAAPEAAWASWTKAYRQNKVAMDATFAFEKDLFGPRKSAVKGCWGTLESGVVKYVKAGKFKSKDAFLEGMSGPVGYVLMNALGACYTVTSPQRVGLLLLGINDKTRSWRGPRAAVRWAMVDTLSSIKEDRTRFPISFGAFQSGSTNLIRQEARNRGPNLSDGYNQIDRGVVKKVSKPPKTKDTVLVAFKTESWMEDTHECWNTNKVRKIGSDGTVQYFRKCKNTGRAKRTFTPKATHLFSWAAKGIKANAFVRVAVPAASDYGDRGRWGFPVEVYLNKQKKKLISMYGFTL